MLGRGHEQPNEPWSGDTERLLVERYDGIDLIEPRRPHWLCASRRRDPGPEPARLPLIDEPEAPVERNPRRVRIESHGGHAGGVEMVQGSLHQQPTDPTRAGDRDNDQIANEA
jgi:hypothetical protein